MPKLMFPEAVSKTSIIFLHYKHLTQKQYQHVQPELLHHHNQVHPIQPQNVQENEPDRIFC